MKMHTLRLQLWSGPRNVSTALMYSFAQRADTRVVDEPLYAHYLRVSGAQHPGRDDVLRSQSDDVARVVREVILGACDRPVLFVKQMAHHLIELDHGFLRQTANVLLVRDPREMLPSLVQQIPEPTLRDAAYAMQAELYDELRRIGQDPVVLDAREVLLDPRSVLGELCARIGLPFDAAMLHWKPGARSEDGVWAQHWYQGVHLSTGFQPYHAKQGPFPRKLKPLLDQCRPFYERLQALAIKAPARTGSTT
jgi:hypothetical protein